MRGAWRHAGTQNTLAHTVGSLLIRLRRYASRSLTKVLLIRHAATRASLKG